VPAVTNARFAALHGLPVALSPVIHEFGHDYSPDHHSSDYHEALCRIGAKLYALARRGDI